MSRIGKLPIDVPTGVTITVDSDVVTVKGPKGQLTVPHLSDVTVALEGTQGWRRPDFAGANLFRRPSWHQCRMRSSAVAGAFSNRANRPSSVRSPHGSVLKNTLNRKPDSGWSLVFCLVNMPAFQRSAV